MNYGGIFYIIIYLTQTKNNLFTSMAGNYLFLTTISMRDTNGRRTFVLINTHTPYKCIMYTRMAQPWKTRRDSASRPVTGALLSLSLSLSPTVCLQLQRERDGPGRPVEHGDHLIVSHAVHRHSAYGQNPVAAAQAASVRRAAGEHGLHVEGQVVVAADDAEPEPVHPACYGNHARFFHRCRVAVNQVGHVLFELYRL